MDHPANEVIRKDFVIDCEKLNSILFSAVSRSTASVVLHFFGDIGAGKSYLGGVSNWFYIDSALNQWAKDSESNSQSQGGFIVTVWNPVLASKIGDCLGYLTLTLEAPSQLSSQKKLVDHAAIETSARKLVIINEADSNCHVLNERTLKEYDDSTNWLFILTSNSKDGKLKFQPRFMNWLFRSWKFETYATILDELLEVEFSMLERDEGIRAFRNCYIKCMQRNWSE